MITGISAVTLATHDMQRAVRFYQALGVEMLYGGEEASFTSFRAGPGFLNLIAQPADRRWSWWGRLIFYDSDVATRSTPVSSPPATSRMRPRATRRGASAFSTSPIPTVTS